VPGGCAAAASGKPIPARTKLASTTIRLNDMRDLPGEGRILRSEQARGENEIVASRERHSEEVEHGQPGTDRGAGVQQGQREEHVG
jgi:hypothetical protein